MKTLRFFLLFWFAVPTAAQDASVWENVAKALGRSGDERGGVYRVSFPRTDLQVRVGDTAVRTGMAMGAWAAFQSHGKSAMVMGDLVLLPSELPAVTAALQEGGIDITAIHNHLAGEQPRLIYLHYCGHGDAVKLAEGLHSALSKTATPEPRPAASAPEEMPDVSVLEKVLGLKGTSRGGVLNFTIPRKEAITQSGVRIGARMGVGTVINFQKTEGGAATTGDFVLLASEVQTVIRALRSGGIEVTALHSHMLDEQPRLFFMHFWGVGPEEKLATAFHAALAATGHVLTL